MTKSTFLWTASDPLYASVNGEDLIPDLALGRFTAATLDEATLAVQKILDSEGSEETLDGKAVLVAFSPSGLSFNDTAQVFQRAIVHELAQGDHQRLGDLVLAAQEDYAATGAFPELLSIYHLFGDPALRVR